MTIEEARYNGMTEVTGVDSGDTILFQVNPRKNTSIEVVPTTAGSGTIGATMGTTEPADFTGFSMDTSGATTVAKFINLGGGISYVGCLVTSGVFTVRVFNA